MIAGAAMAMMLRNLAGNSLMLEGINLGLRANN
jgi:hypothetical protein